MPERLNFFTDVTRDNNEISLDTRLMSLDLRLVSTLQAKVQSLAAWFSTNAQLHITSWY